ncbi:hypothetical protein BN946_scf184817.g31 [Trametes cinnabarina]|uniref:Isopenicillin N synthase-like Fe(2+) 2OG dioxygenase domain-containing protein n=1 Tax=Pycnoporus cinnabarinus TaxID=5643 RepID=A0A060S5K7_PYCCI|nr:hypothetical protein BN946_scf184817.g31 [Trametes cinnabarina]
MQKIAHKTFSQFEKTTVQTKRGIADLPGRTSYKARGATATDETGAPDTVEFINIAKDDALAWPAVARRTYPATVTALMDDAVVPFVRKSVVVNDTLVMVPGTDTWHGGLLKSNLHRVVPPPGEQGTYTRWSLVYFTRPGDSVLLRTLADQSSIVAKAVKDAPEHLRKIFESLPTSQEWFTRRVKNMRTNNQKDQASYVPASIKRRNTILVATRICDYVQWAGETPTGCAASTPMQVYSGHYGAFVILLHTRLHIYGKCYFTLTYSIHLRVSDIQPR